ncbi:MAG: hypothetical protein DRR04_06640 [Gammaproteobacteria bacterium]|nr:MAG: hypothetical protein DRQ97_01130 [Gammaproteobacteria bacterium]RLA60090.1 MAG: hypothetical protein DRR04_06640 [Gammaproteobacteria bacterium]
MQGLSLETIPPIHIPFRFFNTAPWMGVLAALVLLFDAGGAFSSQWSPELLAVTHLLTLGFMAMVMLGAMFQLVPVISGRMIPGGAIVATGVHLLLSIGVLLLVAGFYWKAYWLFAWALPVLLTAFAMFLLALGSLLLRQIGGGDAIYSIRFAALSLLITIGLGVLRSANYAGLMEPLALANIANIHLAWGLVGWVLLLVMGASYQVIPMFHVTPSYPVSLARALPAVVFLSLLLLSVVDHTVVQALVVFVLCTVAIVYAIYTIGLLNQRKRKIPDNTARFWRLSLVCLIASALLLAGFYFAGHLLSSIAIQQQLPVIVGILMIYGFAGSVIMGMLQKIVPFLAYLHLQRSCLSNFELLKTLPHMGEIIPESRSRWQFRIHLSALLVLLAVLITGGFVGPAALLLVADFAWLGYTLASATRLYRNTAVRIALTP